MRRNKKSLVGQIFDRLTVTKDSGERVASTGETIWECLCSCENIRNVATGKLRKGEVKKCSACPKFVSPPIDLTGQRFTRLVVVGKAKQRNPNRRENYWACTCDCGAQTVVVTGALRNGQTRSCGCLQRETAQGINYKHGKSQTRAYQQAYTRKRQAAKLQRTPAWQDPAELITFYESCPVGYTVDHMCPLQGDLICGLHVIQNFQYLTKSQNSAKGKKFTPYIQYPNGEILHLSE